MDKYPVICSCCGKADTPPPGDELPEAWYIVTIKQAWRDGDGYTVCPECVRPVEIILRGKKE